MRKALLKILPAGRVSSQDEGGQEVQEGHDGRDLERMMRNQLNTTQLQKGHDGRDLQRVHDYYVMMVAKRNQLNTIQLKKIRDGHDDDLEREIERESA